MSDDEELHVRACNWIEQSPGGGHHYACRAWPQLPEQMRDVCNCGRDNLLRDLAAAFAPKFQPTNGSGDHGEDTAQ